MVPWTAPTIVGARTFFRARWLPQRLDDGFTPLRGLRLPAALFGTTRIEEDTRVEVLL